MPEPARWRRYLDHCMGLPAVGFDTEFQDGKVTFWSLAIPRSTGVGAFGYVPARGYVLPAEALVFFRPLLESPSTVKWAHNAVADTRVVFDSTGIIMVNTQDTLSWARVARPGLPAYGLKQLAGMLLGKRRRPTYAEVLGYLKKEERTKTTKRKLCSCGVKGCKKRLGHVRSVIEESLVVTKEVPAEYLHSELAPGHPAWDAWIAYAMEDAIDALELADYLNRAGDKLKHHPLGPLGKALCREYFNTRGET